MNFFTSSMLVISTVFSFSFAGIFAIASSMPMGACSDNYWPTFLLLLVGGFNAVGLVAQAAMEDALAPKCPETEEEKQEMEDNKKVDAKTDARPKDGIDAFLSDEFKPFAWKWLGFTPECGIGTPLAGLTCFEIRLAVGEPPSFKASCNGRKQA